MVNVAGATQTLVRRVCVARSTGPGHHVLTKRGSRGKRFQGLTFPECFKCWVYVLGLQRSFCYFCFAQFCSSSLSFIEITSFGILTTNRWEILFQICIFRIKHTFPLVLAHTTKEYTLWELYNIWKHIFLWQVTFVQNAKRKKLFCGSFVIMAIHLVVFSSY